MADSGERTFILKPGDVDRPAPLPAAMGHYLVSGEIGAERRIRIDAAGITIGRAAGCDLLLTAAVISRRHCRIEIEDDWAVLTDLGSSNGTFVNDAPVVVPTRLRNGARLRLGTVPLKYERRDPHEVDAEAELGRDIQRAVEYARAILPAPIESGPVRADWYFAPCAKLGGDMFGYQFLEDGCFAGFLLDVSGHGIGAAMHAVAVGNAVRRRALPGTDLHDPAAVAAGLNAMFQMEDHHGLMLTLWCWAYDVGQRELRFCCAGHHASLLAIAGQAMPLPLGGRNPAIGMLAARQWPVEQMTVPPGSRLYLFSDGAFDLVGADGKRWRLDHIVRLIAEGSAAGVPEPERLYRAVRAAAPPGPLADDFSALVIAFD
jgi:Stage II sporulation protein E (SpoIIE)/FHA domain